MTDLTVQEENDLAHYVGDYLEGTISASSLLDPSYRQSEPAASYRSSLKKDASISLRLPQTILTQLKQQAVQKGIPYQTLITSWIYEKIGG